jgi:membrane protease YdiL (CAAX protease family)
MRSSHGLLRPGRFLWARVLPWSVVFGLALWITYKFFKGVIIGLGLGGTGLPTTIGVLATLALYTASVRLIERRSPDELGLAQLVPELALGVTFGAVLFSVIMAVLLAIGAYGMTGPTAAAPWLPLADSLEGIVEELIFRGAIFRLLSSIFGVWWALGLSSALFGAWHLVKPGADLIAVLGVMFAGGIPMTALYIVTGRLWASIGYHMAWNFTEAYVFGAGVSGGDFGPSLFQVRAWPGVDAFWSGGNFGPEASVVTLLFGLLVSAALIVLSKRRKRFAL